jgi:hypothetical protein
VSFAIVHYPGDGMMGWSASRAGENLIMAWPSDREDPPALLLLHVSSCVGLHGPRCSSRLPPPPRRRVATEGTLGCVRHYRLSR